MVHIRLLNTMTAVLNAPRKVSAATPSRLLHHNPGHKRCNSYAVSLEPSVQTDTDNKHRVSPLTCSESGPHSSPRFRANRAAAYYTPYSVRKDAKPSAEPLLVNRNTFVPGGSLSRLVDRPHFEPLLSKGVLPLIIAANGPYSDISLTQTFNHSLFYVCNGRYFGVKKAKNTGIEQERDPKRNAS